MKALLASPDFMMKDVSSLRNFSWDGLYYTMKNKAPTLVELLQSCIPQRSTRMKFVMVMLPQCLLEHISAVHLCKVMYPWFCI